MRSLALAAVLALASAAHAQTPVQGPTVLETFHSFCQETEAVGFVRTRGEWKSSTFALLKHGVMRVSKPLEGELAGGCAEAKPAEITNTAAALRYGCYAFAPVDAKRPRMQWCREAYSNGPGGWKLSDVQCTGPLSRTVSFTPDGGFVIETATSAVGGYPDGMYTSEVRIGRGMCVRDK